MKNTPYIPIDELIADLQDHKFYIGVDTYQRVLQLLGDLDLNAHYHELDQILCPLFATTEEEQILFNKLYFKHFPAKDAAEGKPDLSAEASSSYTEKETLTEELKPKALPKRKLFVGITAVAIILLSIISIFIYIESSEVSEAKINKTNDTIEQINKVQEEKQFENENLNDSLKQIENEIKYGEENTEVETEKLEKRDSLKVETKVSLEELRQLARNENFQEQEKEKVKREKENKKQEIILYASIISLLLLFLAYEIYRIVRRRLIANRKKGRKPPYVWSIHIDEQKVDLEQDMYFLANQMRARIETQDDDLDIAETVKSIAENAGIINPKYLFRTRPVEYLMLIDWSSRRNHQSQLFEHLYKTFKDNNVYI